jgi:hypothetical protein
MPLFLACLGKDKGGGSGNPQAGRRAIGATTQGGKYKVGVKDFPAISPDANDHIVIAFTRGSADEPKICGIQILR